MEAVEKEEEKVEACECPILPPLFVMGLRAAIDTGLSCEQITAFLVLFTGLYETADTMEGKEIVERAEQLSEIMRGDVDYVCARDLLTKRNKERRKAQKRLQKRKKGIR
jgi:hypothetical protein